MKKAFVVTVYETRAVQFVMTGESRQEVYRRVREDAASLTPVMLPADAVLDEVKLVNVYVEKSDTESQRDGKGVLDFMGNVGHRAHLEIDGEIYTVTESGEFMGDILP